MSPGGVFRKTRYSSSTQILLSLVPAFQKRIGDESGSWCCVESQESYKEEAFRRTLRIAVDDKDVDHPHKTNIYTKAISLPESASCRGFASLTPSFGPMQVLVRSKGFMWDNAMAVALFNYRKDVHETSYEYRNM